MQIRSYVTWLTALFALVALTLGTAGSAQAGTCAKCYSYPGLEICKSNACVGKATVKKVYGHAVKHKRCGARHCYGKRHHHVRKHHARRHYACNPCKRHCAPRCARRCGSPCHAKRAVKPATRYVVTREHKLFSGECVTSLPRLADGTCVHGVAVYAPVVEKATGPVPGAVSGHHRGRLPRGYYDPRRWNNTPSDHQLIEMYKAGEKQS